MRAEEHELPVCGTCGDVTNQQPLAYTGSSGMIEIAVRNGNAAKALRLKEGDPVTALKKVLAKNKIKKHRVVADAFLPKGLYPHKSLEVTFQQSASDILLQNLAVC